MYNDGDEPASANLAIVRLVKLDFATPKNTRIELVNPMAGFGSNAAKNVPKGWNGQYTAGAGSDANWKSNNGWSENGHLFAVVYRQDTNSPLYTMHDSTIIRSDDAGLHWCNPYTLSLTPAGRCPATAAEFAASGLASYGYSLQRLAEGDAPLPPVDASYSAATPAMLFQAADPNAAFVPAPVLTCQDESTGNGVTACPTDNGHDTYMYMLATDGNRRRRRLARILKSKLETKFSAGDFEVYTCATQWRAGGVCDGTQPEHWTNVLANGTVVQFDHGAFAELHSLSSAILTPVDGAGTRRYLLVGNACRQGGPCFAAAETAPKPWGPWTRTTLAPPPDNDNFFYPLMASYRLSEDGRLTVAVAASPRLAFPLEGSPYFYQYEFAPRRTARAIGSAAAAERAPRGRPEAAGKLGLHYCTAPGENACVPANGLVSALEFGEPEGFDWTNPGAGGLQNWTRPYATNAVGDMVCMVTGGHDSNRQWQGTNSAGLRGWGMMLDSVYYGFRDKCVMYDGKGPETNPAINTHSTPAPLTGDQDWTVVTVFKVSNTTTNWINLWSSLNCAPPNYPPCAGAGGAGGVRATASMNFLNTAQGKGNGSLGLLFDVAGGALLGCCTGVATAPDQIKAGSIYALAYVKKAGAVNPATVNADDPVLKIWKGGDRYAGTALTVYGDANAGPPRTSASNYFYFGWADSGGSSSTAGNHADVTYYYNLIYSRTLTDAEWLRLYAYLKAALAESPAQLTVQ